MAWVYALLPAEASAALRAALDAAADLLKIVDRENGAEPRTVDQRRADVLAEMGWLALDTGHIGGCPEGTRLGNAHGHRPRVRVTARA
jgi:hypothetical protein